MGQPKERILIVDDEKNIRLTVSYTLQPLGYQVETAVNGEEALHKLKEASYSLVLLDLRMPGMDGMQLLRHIARDYSDVPVAIITAHGTVENAVDAMKLGAIDFIRKPFTPAELRDLVAAILERRQMLATAQRDYAGLLTLVKHLISVRQFDEAGRYAKEAVGRDPSRPEAFNLLGVLHRLLGHEGDAQKNFRVALDLDPAYQPARENLSRTADPVRRHEAPNLG
ncbi:MAG: response regulator [Chloroflexi bacterium]|nr:response regulator [Chloroflexota bacterium]